MVNKNTELRELAESAYSVLQEEDMHVELFSDMPVVFIGDLHGDIVSLEQVLSRYQGSHKLVFLGDFINGPPVGGSSVKTITSLIRVKLDDPEGVFLIRGNHEFVNEYSEEFLQELRERSGEKKYIGAVAALTRLFGELPYSLSTPNGVLALHGSVPDISDRYELVNLPSGILRARENDTVCQIVGNRISKREINNDEGYKPIGKKPSPIKHGYKFFDQVMAVVGSKVLVRGHQKKAKGYRMNDRALTIMTCEQHKEDGKRKGSYVAIMDPQTRITSARQFEVVHF